ncbi:hypothetical protein J6590_002798 [Homalodisca vitripennis]|nr:hypothetical protein J6590_002797 [Homalodisca vitripennis]KAG8303793.1 hypothetical protein J6590_002798 [Homalodisca vitripennis]
MEAWWATTSNLVRCCRCWSSSAPRSRVWAPKLCIYLRWTRRRRKKQKCGRKPRRGSKSWAIDRGVT